jgi:hypothetical protein
MPPVFPFCGWPLESDTSAARFVFENESCRCGDRHAGG